MDIDIWKPRYGTDFDQTKYLYHYTSIEKAISIIHSKHLLFSQLAKTNDTTESKVRISYMSDSSDEKVKDLEKFFEEHFQLIRLLCFCTDVPALNSTQKQFLENDRRRRYRDVTGRGLALPRMWAQYAANNGGVCFIVNKNKLEKQINKSALTLISLKVNYKSFFSSYTMNETDLNNLHGKITSGPMLFNDIIRAGKFFSKHMFFTKSKDWEGEHEYRYITIVKKEEEVFKTGDLFDYLEGVVVGENIIPAYKKVIKIMLEGQSQIRRIVFSHMGAELKYLEEDISVYQCEKRN